MGRSWIFFHSPTALRFPEIIERSSSEIVGCVFRRIGQDCVGFWTNSENAKGEEFERGSNGVEDEKGVGEGEKKDAATSLPATVAKKKRSGFFTRIFSGIFRHLDDFEKRLQYISKEEATVLARLQRRSSSWRRMARNLILFSVFFEEMGLRNQNCLGILDTLTFVWMKYILQKKSRLRIPPGKENAKESLKMEQHSSLKNLPVLSNLASKRKHQLSGPDNVGSADGVPQAFRKMEKCSQSTFRTVTELSSGGDKLSGYSSVDVVCLVAFPFTYTIKVYVVNSFVLLMAGI